MAATGNKKALFQGLPSKSECGFRHSITSFQALTVLSFQQHAKTGLIGNKSGNKEFS
jgi:hypothetical protein